MKISFNFLTPPPCLADSLKLLTLDKILLNLTFCGNLLFRNEQVIHAKLTNINHK